MTPECVASDVRSGLICSVLFCCFATTGRLSITQLCPAWYERYDPTSWRSSWATAQASQGRIAEVQQCRNLGQCPAGSWLHLLRPLWTPEFPAAAPQGPPDVHSQRHPLEPRRKRRTVTERSRETGKWWMNESFCHWFITALSNCWPHPHPQTYFSTPSSGPQWFYSYLAIFLLL